MHFATTRHIAVCVCVCIWMDAHKPAVVCGSTRCSTMQSNSTSDVDILKWLKSLDRPPACRSSCSCTVNFLCRNSRCKTVAFMQHIHILAHVYMYTKVLRIRPQRHFQKCRPYSKPKVFNTHKWAQLYERFDYDHTLCNKSTIANLSTVIQRDYYEWRIAVLIIWFKKKFYVK